MPQHPFDGVRAKINRAEQNLENLRGAIACLIAEHYHVATHPYGNKISVNLSTTAKPEHFVHISALAGEIIYQLRSALDHAFWQLVEGDPIAYGNIRDFSFPICDSPGHFRNARNWKTRGKPPRDGEKWPLVDGAEALIEGLQPYKRRDDVHNDALWRLNKISIIDRHRLLMVASHAVPIPLGKDSGFGPGSVYIVPLDPDAPVMFHADPEDAVDMQRATLISVQLDELAVPVTKPVTEILEELVAAAKTVVETLAPLRG
jgi:hypothetical protein